MSKKPKQSPRDAARPENKVSFDEVTALVKERRKYADWIAALEAKREQTPESVYAKVHLDYESRLEAVMEKLQEHRTVLSEERELLRRKVEGVAEQIEVANEKRAETELRAQVGELSAAALTEALRVADTEIERLEAKQAAFETDLEKVEEFFAALEGTGRVSRPTPRVRDGGFDELGFLQSVVGAQRPQAGAPAAEAPTPKAPKVEPPPTPPSAPPAKPVDVPKPEEPKAPEPSRPPEEPRLEESKSNEASRAADEKKSADKKRVEEVEAEPPKSAASAQADGVVEKAVELDAPPPPPPPKLMPRQSIAIQMANLTIEPGAETRAQPDLGIIKTGDELPPSILEDLTPGAGGTKPLAANIASNNPLSLKGSTPSDLKTLKCRECGAMNDPSEWYCERCGAELSAI